MVQNYLFDVYLQIKQKKKRTNLNYDNSVHENCQTNIISHKSFGVSSILEIKRIFNDFMIFNLPKKNS